MTLLFFFCDSQVNKSSRSSSKEKKVECEAMSNLKQHLHRVVESVGAKRKKHKLNMHEKALTTTCPTRSWKYQRPVGPRN